MPAQDAVDFFQHMRRLREVLHHFRQQNGFDAARFKWDILPVPGQIRMDGIVRVIRQVQANIGMRFTGSAQDHRTVRLFSTSNVQNDAFETMQIPGERPMNGAAMDGGIQPRFWMGKFYWGQLSSGSELDRATKIK